jgi:2-amino-4-hydroxy-6-hydroxymethyldihydropteridine diphosphokinase
MSHPKEVRRVVYSLGSNLGDRFAMLQGAVDQLSGSLLLRELRVSPVYETAPVGGPEQPAYLNAVVVCESAAAPLELLGVAYQVEQAHGRTREEHWGARTLDVDLLMVGELVDDDPTLTIPHPRAHDRAFVLVPWSEVDPAAVLVGHGAVAALARAAVDREGADAVRVTDHDLVVPA